MSFRMASKPSELEIKQMPDENPYELSPVALDSIDMMRHTTKFTQLPQEPPPAPAPRSKMAETTISVPVPSPTYKNPPSYNARAHGLHLYEEVNQANLQRKKNQDISEYGSPPVMQQSSIPEADQGIFFSQQSSTTNSLAHLTESTEKRPRKKMNPLYDSYRESDASTEVGRNAFSMELPPPSKPKGPASHVGSILRHPCTMFLVVVFIIALIIVLVLLMLGTITSKGLVGGQTSALTQANATSAPSPAMSQLQAQVSQQEDVINTLMAKINMLEMALTTPGNENASVEVRVAQNTLTLMTLQSTVDDLELEGLSAKSTASLAHERSVGVVNTVAALQNQARDLENETATLDARVNSLSGNLQTHSLDIRNIKANNLNQDNRIVMLDSRVGVVQQDLEASLSQYNETIFQELMTISKMQGPRGFNGSDGASGAGDLSQCTYEMSTRGTALSTPTTTSQISPAANEIFTGIACSTSGGARAILKTVPPPFGTSDPTKFYCECTGEFNAQDSVRYCDIHYWKCPTS